jgi:heme exporter protein C
MQIARETTGARQATAAPRKGARPLAGLSAWERVMAGVGALTVVGMVASIWAIFAYAPTDALQGVVQRIFYFHVPMAWDAYLAFFIVFVASVVYLWRRDERWDWVARAAAEIGTVFTTLVLITGSLWGKPIWGTWWTWDARLTTTLILWFIYVGYLMLRSYTGRTPSGARMAAVLGIVGFVDVPIDYLSVTWWRTIHPAAVYIIDNGQAQLPPAALQTFFLALITFTLFFVFLLGLVYQLEWLQAGVEKLRGRIES